jgi:hypothetical protein
MNYSRYASLLLLHYTSQKVRSQGMYARMPVTNVAWRPLYLHDNRIMINLPLPGQGRLIASFALARAIGRSLRERSASS